MFSAKVSLRWSRATRSENVNPLLRFSVRGLGQGGDAGDLWLDELQSVFPVCSQQCGEAWTVPILKRFDVL